MPGPGGLVVDIAVAWSADLAASRAAVRLDLIPSGAKRTRSTTCSQVEWCAAPRTSPAALYMAFEYWKAAPNFAVGFADVAARTYSARDKTAGSAARSA